MEYTKQQLKDAFCEAMNYDSEKDGTKAEFLQAFVDKVDARRQIRIDRMKTGLEQAKEIALEHLLQAIRDNNESSTL